jgi:hypothetical protein
MVKAGVAGIWRFVNAVADCETVYYRAPVGCCPIGSIVEKLGLEQLLLRNLNFTPDVYEVVPKAAVGRFYLVFYCVEYLFKHW